MMLAIYRTAWCCVARNPVLFLVGAGLFLAVDVYNLVTDARNTGKVVAWFVFVYGLHRAVLLGEGWRGQPARSDAPKQAIGWFLLAALLLVGLSLIAPAGLLFWTLANQERLPVLVAGILVFSLLAFVVAYALVLSVFGTALPAAAVRDRFGLCLTLSRARKTAPGVLVGLIAGPGLFGALTLAAQIALARLIGPIPALYEDGAGLSLTALLWEAPLKLLALFNATLTVAVLCRAYRKVAPPEVAALLQPDPGQAMRPVQVPA